MVNKGKVSYYNTLEEKTNFKNINGKIQMIALRPALNCNENNNVE